MKEIWNELEEKPEWLTWEDIIEYAKKMGVEELPSTQDNTAKKEIQDMLDRNYEKEKKVGLGEGYNVSTKEYNKFCKDYNIDPNDYDDVLFTLDELEGEFGDKNGKLQRIREYVINKVNDGLQVLDQTEKEQTLEKPFNDFVLVYQLQESKGYRFMSYEYAKDKINLDDYELVAKVPLYKEYSDVNEALEYVFSYGNSNADFYRNNPKARSISVSDILQYKGNNYYVDSFGFVLIGKGDKLIEANIHSGSENSNIDLEKEKEDIQKQLNDVEEIETMKKELDDKMDDLFEENKEIESNNRLLTFKLYDSGYREYNGGQISSDEEILTINDLKRNINYNWKKLNSNSNKEKITILKNELTKNIKTLINTIEIKITNLEKSRDTGSSKDREFIEDHLYSLDVAKDNCLEALKKINNIKTNEFVQTDTRNISDNELKENKENKTDSIYYTYSIYTMKDKNDTWTWKDSFESEDINDKKEVEEKAKARVKELKDSGEFFDVMYKEWENNKEEDKKYDIDISKYDTTDKIKARIKEINKELAYCRRRDKVCATFGGDQQVYDLNVERDKLKTKLNKFKRIKNESKSQMSYNEFLKELDLAKEGKSNKIKIYKMKKEIKEESKKIDLNKKLTPEEIRNIKLQDLDKDVQDYIKEIDTLENIQKHLDKLGNYYSKFKDSEDDEDFQKEPIISLNDYLKAYKKEFKKESK